MWIMTAVAAGNERSRKRIRRAGYIIKETAVFVVLVFVGISMLNYFIFPTPTYADGDSGLVDLDYFYDVHEKNVLHHPHWSAIYPVMLIEPDCPYVMDLAERLYSEYEWRTLKNILLWISIHIDYMDDRTLYGVDDYWALPCETLHYTKGDCEDFAILFCSIAIACGLDVCLLDYDGHMSAGVVLDGTLYSCNLFSGSISQDLHWEGESPHIVRLDHHEIYKVSQAFAWSNKWLHKGTDWMLT